MSTEKRSTTRPARRPTSGGGMRPAGSARPRPARPARDDRDRPRAGSTRPRTGATSRPRTDSGARRAPERNGAPRGSFRRRDDAAPRSREGFVRREGDARGESSSYTPRPRREGGAPRTREGFVRREGGAPRSREGFVRRDGGAPRSREGFVRREGGARGERSSYTPRPRREGGAPRSREGFRPREERGSRDGFRPRAERAPREGFRPRAERAAHERAPREGFRPREERAPREGFRPRTERAPREGFRPRTERAPHERAPREGFRPRSERTPREDFRRESERPREGERPRGDFRPRGGPREGDRPRFERPRFERGAHHDEGGDQRGAVNRSRPAYPQGPHVRYRRDGKPSPRPAGWAEPRHDRDDRRSGGRPGAPPADRSGGPAHRPRDDRRTPVTHATDGPSLPADPREAALRILHAVDTRSAFSDRLLDGAHARAGADPRDRALLHELVKGSLRWRGRLDAALDARVHVGLANTQPWIRNILRLGAYQILFLDRVPAHAAVDESVKLAHKYAHPGAAGLVNSVLRRLAEERATLTWPSGDDAESLATWGSHPRWIVERWLARFGPAETRALLEADNRAVPTGLRANTLRNTREQLIEMLAREGVEARPGTLSPDLVWVDGHHSPGALHCFRAGLCTAQDESEALVGRVVAPKPHERVLDLCAAPGGKSTHLAELMGDDGEVWAVERDAHRVATLQATLERLGTHSVHVVHGDGRSYEFPMPFDRVLVDAPCSGMGVLARRADARWRKGPEVLAEMPPVQLELLRAAGRYLSPGGLLVYSVCSFEPEETEHVIARFLAEHPGWKLESVAGTVPDAVVTPEGTMLVLPHRHGCDGAFAARLRKP